MALYCDCVVWGFYQLVLGRRIPRFLFRAGSGHGDIGWYYASGWTRITNTGTTSWFRRRKSALFNLF